MKKKINIKDKIKKEITKGKKLLKNVWEILNLPEMGVLPGELAFSIILSLVPIITVIGYGASYFNISMDSIIELLQKNFDKNVVELIIPIIGGNKLDLNLIWLLIVMFYFASSGAASVIFSANQIYHIEQSSWIKRRIKALMLTLLIVVLYLFILLVPVFGAKIIDAIDYFNIKSVMSYVLEIIQGPISWLIIFLFIKMIFTIAPDKRIPSSRINLGAIFTTIGWVLTTEIYSYYVSHFAQYDLFYAGLSNIAVLMLWIYFLSYIMVIGLALTTKIDDEEMAKTGSINIK